MLTDYIQFAIKLAKYEILQDDKSFYGEIPGFQGVYANALTLEECREELLEVLEDWITLRLSKNLSIPVIGGMDLSIKELVNA